MLHTSHVRDYRIGILDKLTKYYFHKSDITYFLQKLSLFNLLISNHLEVTRILEIFYIPGTA